MKTKTILKAIDVLKRVGAALRGGGLEISQQIALASECSSAEFYLQHELENAVPEVKISEDA